MIFWQKNIWLKSRLKSPWFRSANTACLSGLFCIWPCLCCHHATCLQQSAYFTTQNVVSSNFKKHSLCATWQFWCEMHLRQPMLLTALHKWSIICSLERYFSTYLLTYLNFCCRLVVGHSLVRITDTQAHSGPTTSTIPAADTSPRRHRTSLRSRTTVWAAVRRRGTTTPVTIMDSLSAIRLHSTRSIRLAIARLVDGQAVVARAGSELACGMTFWLVTVKR